MTDIVPQYRSIDGSGNNLSQTDLNAAGTDFTRIGPANFADGVDAMTGGPNPRTISNVVFGQGNAAVPDPEGLSAYMYAWGQFIDHDIELTSDGTTHIDIPVPPGDPVFPAGSVIAMTRAVIDPATGQNGKPATAVNAITGWLDASMVYGSSQATSDFLRLPDGHMKTSDGNNLPIVNGAFLAGDVRVQENPALTALQTLFVREHNYQVDLLHQEHPTWSGDELYEQARAIVTAEIENITYSEFLPHLLGPNAIEPYHGYDPTVDPRITEQFAGAAFRFGHSIVSDETARLTEQGAVNGPTLELKDTFFLSPTDFTADSGADGFLRELASDSSLALDARIVDGLRNFLSDPPDGQDLAAIDIQRGRDLGLGTLNQTRVALGLMPYTSFNQITSDPGTLQALRQAYGSVGNVDLFTGGLAENHLPGAMVGQTFEAIIATQFENLRDGDRLWFQNQGFDPQTLAQIEQTTLADIIERDTNTQHIQDDVFVTYDRHSGTAGGVPSTNPDAPQLVIGSAGPDTLTGGPQGDILVAGTGQQTMTGGGGADKFVFDQAVPTNATITDFLPGTDKIELDGLQSSTAAGVNEVNGNTVIQVGDDQITLAGVTPNQLSPDDFITVFAPTVPPSGPNPSPPAGTTAAMILRHGADGKYEIYDIGNNSVLAAYQLGQVGTDWAFVTLGDFNGTDTTDMLLRNTSTGAFEVYDISNNNITNAASLGTVGLNWQVAGFADFNGDGMTDMMLRNSNTGALEIYNIRNNMIINAAASGTVGLNWQVGGFGNFSSVPGETDMIMRFSSTGGLEVYFNNNQSIGAAFMGTVGLEWQIIGFGNFSSIPGETDMIMRNSRTGGLEVYDIKNNQITGAAFIGTVGLDWLFAGIAPVHGPGASDVVLRNVNTGAFEVYDIANNQLSGAAALGAVGLDWQTGSIAAAPPSASMGSSDASTSQLVQAMAGFGGGSGAADSLNAAAVGADTSQQTFLTAPHA